MLSVDCTPRQNLSIQTGGPSVTRRFRSLRKSNILIESFSHCVFLSTRDLTLVMGKNDHCMLVGLDHRCVHCTLQSCVGKKKKWKRRISFKNWRPLLDCDDAPTQYQNHIRQQLQTTSRVTADTLEKILIQAAQRYGQSNQQTICFHPSMRLKEFRALRRRTTDPRSRKIWSLQIRNLHCREVRAWKTGQLQMFLGTASRWKNLRKFLPRPSGKHIEIQPHEDVFACMRVCLLVRFNMWESQTF